MAILERYRAYMQAFEDTYVDDDWSRIAPFFTKNAVYEADGEARGRDAVLEKLKAGCDGFDRRMDQRLPNFDAPSVDGNTVTTRWQVTYTKAGLPDLSISGVEVAEFEGDQISLLRDSFDPAAQKAMEQWMAANGAALQS